MKGRAQFACFVVGLLAVLVLFASSAEASVSVPRDVSSIKTDPFASLPQLTSKPVAETLAAAEQADNACIALCELAASIDADPFGYGVKPRPFGGRATPFGRQYQYANDNPTFYVDPTGNYSWNEFKGDAKWGADFAGAFGQDIFANGRRRLGAIGGEAMSQARVLPGQVVDGAQETLARVHDVGVLVAGTNGPLLSSIGQRSTDVMAGGESMADLTQQIGREQGQLASETVANIVTAGGYNIAKESALALGGTAEQAEARLTRAAGTAVLAAGIGGAIEGAPAVARAGNRALVIVEQRVAMARTAIANVADSLPGGSLLNSEFYLKPMPADLLRGSTMGANGAGLMRGTFGRVGLGGSTRLRDPQTGRFISDPLSPPSPFRFTDSQRRAAWRNLAKDSESTLTAEQRLEIQARGWRGPRRYNEYGELETMELSHEPVPLRHGGTEVMPRWPPDHAAIDPMRQLKKRE